MKVLSRIGSLRTRLGFLLLLLPAASVAQTVPYTANGLVSITGGPPIYNGKYVIKQSDFGFFWLDTAALAPGHVQAESKCTGFQPSSDTDIYVIGDCNGITSVSSSGSSVLVRQLNGQCGAATIGCNGPRSDGHSRFTFALGTFEYLGDLGEIPDSTQTTDPLGRTWTIQPTDGNGQNFVWIASGGNPTSPPTASAFFTNVSAQSRGDQTNIYGDRVQLRDTSTPTPTSATWDFNFKGSFVADESGSESVEGTVTGYFPCDPSGSPPGNIRSGAGCMQSLGLSNPPATASYQFALRSANQYGPSPNTFISSLIPFVCPQAVIAGYNGFSGTCSKTGGTLSAPQGGAADASASKGNLGEAQFSWTFTSSGSPTSLQGPIVTVPGGATGFFLTITFPGGYQATASGAVTFLQPLVAAFSTQNPVVRGNPFTLTNLMQKLSTTTLNSVDYLIASGPCGAPPPMPVNPLPASFLTEGGTATVTAPSAIGAYCIYLRFNYTPQGSSPTSQIAAQSLTVTDWSPKPQIGIYLDAGKTQPASFINGSFFLMTGTTYYLSDDEPAPPTGTNYPGAAWTLNSSSGSTSLGSTATQTPLSVKFTSACANFCSLSLTVGGAVQQAGVNISFATCAPDGTTLCLNAGRFRVQVAWATGDGRRGAGQAVPLPGGDTGYFWFFTSGNVELVVKVVDGRLVNSSFWVFAGGLTDVDVLITVTDVQTGNVRTYRNPRGTPFQPIQDTSAFAASSTPTPSLTSEAAAPDVESIGSAGPSAVPDFDLRPLATSGLQPLSTADAACTADATTLCLNQNRFRVRVQWTTGDGRSGAGQAVPLTGDTGYFWFFSSNNVEMVVKAVNGCAFDTNYWVFAGGLTDVNVVMTVTDTQTGAVKTYTNPQGTAFQPIQDTSAFATCP